MPLHGERFDEPLPPLQARTPATSAEMQVTAERRAKRMREGKLFEPMDKGMFPLVTLDT